MKVIIVSPNEADSLLAAGFLEGDGVEGRVVGDVRRHGERRRPGGAPF